MTKGTAWSDEEKKLFIQAYFFYGRDWAAVASWVKTRTEHQCEGRGIFSLPKSYSYIAAENATWFYRLPDGSVHGPCNGNEMYGFIEARYVGGDWAISRNRNGPFGSVGIYFSYSNAFLTANENVNADYAQAVNAYVEKMAVRFFESRAGGDPKEIKRLKIAADTAACYPDLKSQAAKRKAKEPLSADDSKEIKRLKNEIKRLKVAIEYTGSKTERKALILKSHTAPAGESELLSTEVDHMWLERFQSSPSSQSSVTALERASNLWSNSTNGRIQGFEESVKECYADGWKVRDITHAILIRQYPWVYKNARELCCLSVHPLYKCVQNAIKNDVRVTDRLFRIQRDSDRYIPTITEAVNLCSSFLAKIGDSNPMENARYAMQCWSINNYHYSVDMNEEVDLCEKYGKTPM